jgi:hypothetical protein
LGTSSPAPTTGPEPSTSCLQAVWANTVNNSGKVDGRWHYILLTEDDVNDAGLDWEQMKAFGTH